MASSRDVHRLYRLRHSRHIYLAPIPAGNAPQRRALRGTTEEIPSAIVERFEVSIDVFLDLPAC